MTPKVETRKSLEGLIRPADNRIRWIFKNITSFKQYEDSWVFLKTPPNLDTNEKIVGFYINSKNEVDLVIMTNFGLYLGIESGWLFLDYCLMKKVDFPSGEKHTRHHLIITFKNGQRANLPVKTNEDGYPKGDGLYPMYNFLRGMIHSLHHGSHLKNT